MELSDVPSTPALGRARPDRRSAHGRLLGLLLAAALLVPALDRAHAQRSTDQRPAITQLATPEPDRDSARQEAADERIAAFLMAEAREELELGELRSARRRLEIVVTRFASSAVAQRARRMLEQLAVIDGYPMPPMPKTTAPIETARATTQGGGALADRPTGTSLIEDDFSASGGDRVFFAEGSDEVGGRGLRVLKEKAAWLKRHAQVFVRIEGHADDLGGDDINGALALRRAETVRDVLVDAGVTATRMHIAAFGREHRVSPCSAPGCAAQNRRAVLILTDARGTRLSEPSPQAAVGAITAPPQAQGRPGVPSRRDR
jgi:peptidoglycan-associated lipoprotein